VALASCTNRARSESSLTIIAQTSLVEDQPTDLKMFAMDSESPPSPYVDPEDRAIEQIMFNTQMNIQMEEFLAMDDVPTPANFPEKISH
jgi:hypothetical protein